MTDIYKKYIEIPLANYFRSMGLYIAKSTYAPYKRLGIKKIKMWIVDTPNVLTEEDLKKTKIYYLKNSNERLEQEIKKIQNNKSRNRK